MLAPDFRLNKLIIGCVEARANELFDSDVAIISGRRNPGELVFERSRRIGTVESMVKKGPSTFIQDLGIEGRSAHLAPFTTCWTKLCPRKLAPCPLDRS
jgi:hypothetical protein